MHIYYPKPAILRHLPASGHALIEASAGTGKTYTLEHLVVELLIEQREPIELEQILVVTFTEKATGELKARVHAVIRRVLEAFESARREPSSPWLKPPTELPFWEIDEEKRERLERALLAFDVAPIHTIHAFCQKVLTEYAFAHRRLFDQQHVEFHQLFERAFTDTMRRTLARDDELQIWLECWLEVSDVEELKRMMAEAVTSRAEIWPRFREARLEQGLERFGADLWERYRGLYRRRCEGREAAFGRAIRAWQPDHSVARFLMHVDAEVTDFKHSLREVQVETEAQRDFVRFSTALLRFKPAVVQKFLPILNEALEREKQRSGAYTFDDMLELVWRSVAPEQPGSDWLVKALRRRYRYALIDEFQDTDETQWRIFKRLFTETPRERLFMIGDPKQAIYGFRGADVQTYLLAQRELMGEQSALLERARCSPDERVGRPERFEANDDREQELAEVERGERAVRLRLRDNWRSTSSLISGYNAILEQRAERPFFSGEAIRYEHPVRCGDSLRALSGVKEGVEPAAIVLGRMKRGDGARHKKARMDDLYACYGRWIAEEIAHVLSPEGALYLQEGGSDGAPRALVASDVFVLTRTRSDEIKLGEHLDQVGVPYVFVRQESLFETPEAQHLYELLRAVERPRDRGRRLRAWATPFFDVELEELTRCRDLTETHPLYRALLVWHELAASQRFEELFTDVLERSGLVRREIFFGAEDRARHKDYTQLVDVLLEEAHLGRCDIHELVARARAFIEKRRKPLVQHGDLRRVEAREDAVQILTMHKSKGLEAPIVFLYAFGGMAGDTWRFHYPTKQGGLQRALHIHKPEEKISPRLRARVEREDREESERLLYVALTRAKARLYLPFVPYIGQQPCCPYIAQRGYHVLNQRLRDLILELEASAPPEESQDGARAWREVFEVRDIPYFGTAPEIKTHPNEALEALARWRPEARLFGHREHEARARAERDAALLSGRTARFESYTSLKRRAGDAYHVAAAAPEAQALRVDSELGAEEEEIVSAEELPGGVRTGLLLHAMLEQLDCRSLTRARDLETWQRDEQVAEMFERGLSEHGLERRHLKLAQRVVWRALTATVETPQGVVYGLGHALPSVRELEFMYPLDERPGGDLIKGYVDYVFEHQGRIYFADWKSDVLTRYDAASAKAHFEANYTKQAMLYALALCKMFGVHDESAYEARFGAAIYCFLRGMQEDSATGLVTHRATFEELTAFDGEMRREPARFKPHLAAWRPEAPL